MAGNRKVLADLVVQLRADNKKLLRQTRQTQRRMGSFQKSMVNTAKVIGAAFTLDLARRGLEKFVTVVGTFELEMKKVKVIAGATNKEFKALEANARKLGATTKFTATEVANLELQFSKLGFSTSEILKASKATLQLATVTDEDLGESARIVASTIRGFTLDASDTQRVVDLMAKSFSSSALNLEKFAVGMSNVGPVANVAGLSLEETTAILGLLNDRNIDASKAGTDLRNILLELAKQGLTWNQAMGMIRNSTNKNATALRLFGKRASVSSVIIAENEEALNKLNTEIQNNAGFARRGAEEIENTLINKIKALTSATEELTLKFGEESGLAKSMKDSLDVATKLVRKLGELDGQDVVRFLTVSNPLFAMFRANMAGVNFLFGGSGAGPGGISGLNRGGMAGALSGVGGGAAAPVGAGVGGGGGDGTVPQGLTSAISSMPFARGAGLGMRGGSGATSIDMQAQLTAQREQLMLLQEWNETLRRGTEQQAKQNEIIETATRVGVSLGDALFDAASGAQSFGKAMLNILSSLARQAVGGFFGKLFGGFLSGLALGPVAAIPKMAEGGITSGPTLAMIGDNPSGQEAVLPLGSDGKLPITVHIVGRISGEDIVLSTDEFRRRQQGLS